MENVVHCYQNRILRKRIAIANLLQGAERVDIPVAHLKPRPVRYERDPLESPVPPRLENGLPEKNGASFRYSKLLEVILKKHPGHTGRIDQAVPGIAKNALAR